VRQKRGVKGRHVCRNRISKKLFRISNDQLAIILEANEASVEQMIDVRRQQKSILSIQNGSNYGSGENRSGESN
jgi:hypothetical protein